MFNSRHKFKPNDPCPCGSGLKYKKCCQGRIDWTALFRARSDPRPFLSIRGRNTLFLNRVHDALGIDAISDQAPLAHYKRLFTADAVQAIHEAVMFAWPPDTDLVAALNHREDHVCGLYIGDYSPQFLARGIVRHSAYADKILVVDPFIYPPSVRDEFNPLLNPEAFRFQTLRNVNLWFRLAPWIEAGLVEVVRTPGDFDRSLNWNALVFQQEKFKKNPDLEAAAQKSRDDLARRHQDSFKDLLLLAPDDYVARTYEKMGGSKSGGPTTEEFVEHIRATRAANPDILGSFGDEISTGQVTTMSTGAGYEIAKLTAAMAGSYLVTDIESKWLEIKLDRDSTTPEQRRWGPFAHAVHEAPFKYLDRVDLAHALKLREEGRLERLRTFMRKVWRESRNPDEYDDGNSELLGAELAETLAHAEQEWQQIDKDLVKMCATDLKASALGAPLIATGHGDWLAGAVATAGIVNVAMSRWTRRQFPDRFPAAFFMRL